MYSLNGFACTAFEIDILFRHRYTQKQATEIMNIIRLLSKYIFCSQEQLFRFAEMREKVIGIKTINLALSAGFITAYLAIDDSEDNISDIDIDEKLSEEGYTKKLYYALGTSGYILLENKHRMIYNNLNLVSSINDKERILCYNDYIIKNNIDIGYVISGNYLWFADKNGDKVYYWGFIEEEKVKQEYEEMVSAKSKKDKNNNETESENSKSEVKYIKMYLESQGLKNLKPLTTTHSQHHKNAKR